jgi:hypothetical protein
MPRTNDPRVGFESEEARTRKLLAEALVSPTGVAETIGKLADEEHSKLLLLCEHYGIETSPQMFYLLALELARELFPERKKRGRKTKWNALNCGILVAEVERVKRDDKTHGVEWACKQLAKREPWRSLLEAKETVNSTPDPAEALRKIYYEFRNEKWATIFRDAFAIHNQRGDIAEWERKVTQYVKNPHSE